MERFTRGPLSLTAWNGCKGLATMHGPEMAGELTQFLQVVNWMRTALPELAVVVEPLRDMLEAFLEQAPNTPCDRLEITQQGWTEDRAAAWESATDSNADAVPLY